MYATSVSRLPIVASFALCLLCACTPGPPAERAWPAPSHDSTRVWSYVVRHIHTDWLGRFHAQGFVTCLTQNDPARLAGQPYPDPSPALMATLADLQPPIVPYSDCERTPATFGYRYPPIGAPALLLRLLFVRQVGSEVEAIAAWFEPRGFMGRDSLAVCTDELHFFFKVNNLSHVRVWPSAVADCFDADR
jgi:hypothetical protein